MGRKAAILKCRIETSLMKSVDGKMQQVWVPAINCVINVNGEAVTYQDDKAEHEMAEHEIRAAEKAGFRIVRLPSHVEKGKK